MVRKSCFLLAIALMVSLSVVGCAAPTQEESVKAAVATVVAAGTPMPTWTPVPPTLTPRPTSTPTPLPTATPFTGWVKYDSSTGKEVGWLPKGVSPPSDVIGDPGMTYVHFKNGQEDGQVVDTPWWWPVVLGGIPVLLLIVLGVVGAVLWIRRLERKEEARYRASRQALFSAGSNQKQLVSTSGSDVVNLVLATLRDVSPRVFYQVEERLRKLSEGGENEK